MTAFELLIMTTTLLCSLVAGLVFTFAVVVMPGISALDDRRFIEAFRSMDQVIQKQQPVFMIVWIGSAVGMIVSTLVGFGELSGAVRWLLIMACVFFLAGVQAPTIAVNVPMNDHLQALDTDSLSDAELREVREGFETQWNRWNRIRTAWAILTSMLLLALILWS